MSNQNIRTSTIGERGDLNATPGSRPWAVAIKREIDASLHDHQVNHKHLAVLLQGMRQYEGYKTLADRSGQPFANYEAFCVTPQPHGLGYAPADIDAIIEERRDAAKIAAQAKPLQNVGRPESDKTLQCNNLADRGNAVEYLTAKIARDRPDLLERMKAGEFKSVRAAALEAGIVKPRVQFDRTTHAAARALKRHVTPEEFREIVALVTEGEAIRAGAD